MIRFGLIAALALSLAACNPPTIENEAPPPTPEVARPTYPPAASAVEAFTQRWDAKDALGVFEYLSGVVSAAPDGPGKCLRINRQEDMGVIPANAKPTSLRKFAGQRAVSVHCLIDTADSYAGQVLIILPSDSMTATVLHCRGKDGAGDDLCWTLFASR